MKGANHGWHLVFPAETGPFNADSQAEPDAMLLLTDGSVLIHDADPGTAWWRLFPSPSGSYSDGSWIGPFDMEYQRQSFASGIMMDGRVFVVGGEYTNDPNTFEKPGTYSPTGEIFDPDADSWTQLPKPLTPPPAFNYIAGDASSCVLPDGRVLFGSYKDRQSAIYDPTTETWKEAGLGTGNVPDATGGLQRGNVDAVTGWVSAHSLYLRHRSRDQSRRPQISAWI